MPNYDSSGSGTNWASSYVYTTADLAEVRAEPQWAEGVVASTEAPPMYYEMDGHGNIRIIEEDIEPEPTLKELVRDADWTI